MITEHGQRRLLTQIVRFSRALHNAGVAVNSSNLIDLCHCMSLIDIREKMDFYATARTTLVSNQRDIAIFDRVFSEFWTMNESQDRENRDEIEEFSSKEAETEATVEEQLNPESGEDAEQQSSPEDILLSYSPDEVLMKKDFESMSEQEIEKARRLIAELVAILANYKSRRKIVSRKGNTLHMRKMLRQNALYGQDITRLLFRKRRIKKTRIMLLCDVSGSMERYSQFLIQFIYALRKQIAGLEVAVFSTRMTVITEYLETKSVEESLQQVSNSVHDWAGGTNIGGCIREFNDRFAHEMLSSHTVMIILSDGWDRGDAYLMREEMEHLHRRVHKLIWLNPLLGSSNYQPLCRGIQTALPFIDYFLPAHNLESFARLIRHLRTVWH